MKTRYKIPIIIAITIIIVLPLSVRVKPYADSPLNHIEEIKQIPEVEMFYEKYGKYSVIEFLDGAFSYQVGFQATNEQGQWIMLKVNYLFGIPSYYFVHCTAEGLQNQYTIRANVLDYLKNEDCFT